ncbi:MAG TPA: MarR family transcriptional regulator [Kineosporiaceae bacterium]|nr:MarR family transcriptional regulator [Kineosporiaceae bacterium]
MPDATMASGPFPDDVLRRAMRRMFRLSSLLEPHDHGGLQVTVSEVMALGELADVETISQQDLAVLLGLEKSTVSRLAAGLESRGWLVRERDPANRRYYRLRLSDEGREAAERVGQDLRSHHAQLLGALTPTELEALTIGLTGLTRALETLHDGHHSQPPAPGSGGLEE